MCSLLTLGSLTCSATINDSRTQDYHVYGGKYEVHNIGNDSGTSHLTVIDELRGAVSMTTTVNTGFGSKVISKSTGERHSSYK